MAQEYSTLNQISDDHRVDPRRAALELERAGIQPDVELTSNTSKRKAQPIYDRRKIAAALAADLLPVFTKQSGEK